MDGSWILYGARESGHAWKVRQAMVLMHVPHQYRQIDISIPHERRPADFQAASPYGEVPVLVDVDSVQAQSNAILQRLAVQTKRLGGERPRELLQWLFWEANRIGFSLPNIRYHAHFGHPIEDGALSWLRGRLEKDLARLERELEDGRPFLLGEALTVVDLACSAYLNWPEQGGVELDRWPAISAWLGRIRATPGWSHPYELMGGEMWRGAQPGSS